MELKSSWINKKVIVSYRRWTQKKDHVTLSGLWTTREAGGLLLGCGEDNVQWESPLHLL